MSSARSRFAIIFVLVAGAGACGVALKRDLSTIPQGQVGFDDLCGVQPYFDAIEAGTGTEPTVTSEIESEGTAESTRGPKTVRSGRTQFLFETDFQLDEVFRVLDENWRRLPPGLDTTPAIELEVYWTERAGVKRVVADRDATLFFDGRSYPLPYNVCLSELLFGRALYAQRTVARGLRPTATKPLDLALDAGAPDAEDAHEPPGALHGEPRMVTPPALPPPPPERIR
ncbi:MAG TPA: hypothetical protein VHK47_08615 [Polyangia bacterium]|jgi:hypothetical protein|nr:hypothetical protein [Polyangia bacterium]